MACRRPLVLALSVLVPLVSVAVTAAGCGNGEAAEPEDAPSMQAETEGLPGPAGDADGSLERALRERRSVRSFSPSALTRAEIAALLWAAQGVSEPSSGYRTAPSAGATFPLEMFFLEEGELYRYLPRADVIESVASGIMSGDLAAAALGQAFVADAPVVFVIAADYQRTRSRYGDRGDRYVHMEVGHAAQNLLLQAVALGLGAVPVGAFDDLRVREVLDLPPELSPLYIIPVGRPG